MLIPGGCAMKWLLLLVPMLILAVPWSPRAAAQPKPVQPAPADQVTVLYRSHSYTLTGESAKAIRATALAMLRGSCEERQEVDNDNVIQRQFDKALKRSHVLVTFAKAEMVPKAGNNKVPVQVEWLMIPFSPDLDPETIYVRPGKPFRAFRDFDPDHCDDIRAMLIKAGIYLPEPRLDPTPRDPLPG
jgi:hypothetical protein